MSLFRTPGLHLKIAHWEITNSAIQRIIRVLYAHPPPNLIPTQTQSRLLAGTLSITITVTSCHCVNPAYRGKSEAGGLKSRLNTQLTCGQGSQREALQVYLGIIFLFLISISGHCSWPLRIFYFCLCTGMFIGVRKSAFPGLGFNFLFLSS